MRWAQLLLLFGGFCGELFYRECMDPGGDPSTTAMFIFTCDEIHAKSVRRRYQMQI
jgi:hypothetical protein